MHSASPHSARSARGGRTTAASVHHVITEDVPVGTGDDTRLVHVSHPLVTGNATRANLTHVDLPSLTVVELEDVGAARDVMAIRLGGKTEAMAVGIPHDRVRYANAFVDDLQLRVRAVEVQFKDPISITALLQEARAIFLAVVSFFKIG